MDHLLYNDLQNIAALAEETQTLIGIHYAKQSSLPPGRFVEDLVLENLPEKGIGAQGVLSLFNEKYSNKLSNSAGPRYFGFVTGGSTPAAMLGDQLVSIYDQNACGSNDSIAPQLERQALHFLKQLFSLDENYFGSFVTGATMSNFVGLAIGRQWVGEQLGVDISNEGISRVSLTIVSAAPHSSILKSMSMLGIGKKNVVKIDTLLDREAIDLKKLEDYLKSVSTPVIVVANAGTVNTVDFDDLQAIGELKKKYNFWLHVDAAFGGFAALSPNYSHLMKDINYADSITIDAHKWLNVPYDAAMQFTRRKDLQLKVFQNSAAYLGDPNTSPDYFHYTPENSRRWRALPSWFTLMAYGKEGHREIVERNCVMAKKLGDWIYSSETYTLLAPVRMNVVCFTVQQEGITLEKIKGLLDRIRDDGRAYFTPTVYKGVPAIRAALSNWQTEEEDISIAIQVLKEMIGDKDKRTVI